MAGVMAAYAIAPTDKMMVPNSLTVATKRLIIELENNNITFQAGQ